VIWFFLLLNLRFSSVPVIPIWIIEISKRGRNHRGIGDDENSVITIAAAFLVHRTRCVMGRLSEGGKPTFCGKWSKMVKSVYWNRHWFVEFAFELGMRSRSPPGVLVLINGPGYAAYLMGTVYSIVIAVSLWEYTESLRYETLVLPSIPRTWSASFFVEMIIEGTPNRG